MQYDIATAITAAHAARSSTTRRRQRALSVFKKSRSCVHRYSLHFRPAFLSKALPQRIGVKGDFNYLLSDNIVNI